jgi:hypothetical protein
MNPLTQDIAFGAGTTNSRGVNHHLLTWFRQASGDPVGIVFVDFADMKVEN